MLWMAASGDSDSTAVVIVVVVALVIFAVYVWLVYGTLYKVLKRVPPQHRRMTPGHVFLTLIPLFGIVWLFFVVGRVSDSLQNYFRSIRAGREAGDCGRGVGLAWAILGVCQIVLGVLAGLPALICMIIYVTRVNGLSKRIGAVDTAMVEVFE